MLVMFLCSAEAGRFFIPACVRTGGGRSRGQAWPQAIGEAGAQRA
jgi:hypothetical protein